MIESIMSLGFWEMLDFGVRLAAAAAISVLVYGLIRCFARAVLMFFILPSEARDEWYGRMFWNETRVILSHGKNDRPRLRGED